jgi:hypothetical protein
MLTWLRERVLGANNIAVEDIDSIHVVDEPEAVRDIVVEFHDRALVTNADEGERMTEEHLVAPRSD